MYRSRLALPPRQWEEIPDTNELPLALSGLITVVLRPLLSSPPPHHQRRYLRLGKHPSRIAQHLRQHNPRPRILQQNHPVAPVCLRACSWFSPSITAAAASTRTMTTACAFAAPRASPPAPGPARLRLRHAAVPALAAPPAPAPAPALRVLFSSLPLFPSDTSLFTRPTRAPARTHNTEKEEHPTTPHAPTCHTVDAPREQMRHTSPSRWRHARADPTLPTTLRHPSGKKNAREEKTRERGRLPWHLGGVPRGRARARSHRHGPRVHQLAARLRLHHAAVPPAPRPHPDSSSLPLFPSSVTCVPFPRPTPARAHALAHNAEKGEVQGHLD
ncbi:hypothetical protein B0H14DRAFT_3479308 [Mycena olivaceomarginata]|nr:hypothetical protein B0H14DRAFT_3479308 [Mycena olivaceomarginata]